MSSKAKWRNYSLTELKEIVASVNSYRELASKLGYAKDGGGTIRSLHNMVEELKLDVSHFTGQGWTKNNPDLTALTMNSNKKNGSTFLKTLIMIRGYRKCENCDNTEWLNQPIPLQVHHINGEHNDNRLNNLAMLCPNCHALTDSYCLPKSKRIEASKLDIALRGRLEA